MKYLILGSSGQIGGALAGKIKKEKLGEVIEFDIENSKKQDLRLYQNKNLESAMKKADFVFFFAFDVGGSRYLKAYQNTYDFISNNTKIINNTFDALKKSGKPFIFASSQMSNMSYSNYGRLKAVGEAYTKALNGLVVKFWNVYGVEYDLEKSHAITDFIIKAATTKKIDLLTDGTEEREFLYADDCCDCLLKLANKYKDIPRDQELHITSFKTNTILEIANIVAKEYPGTKIIPSKNKDEVQKNKRNIPDKFILSLWKPKTNIETGIANIISVMKKDSKHFFKK